VGGRHPDVGEDDVGPVGGDRPQERLAVADGVRDLEPGLGEQP
jgi:hypothetical protein